MAIVLIAVGSRGDVQPLAALAGELASRGRDAAAVACLAEYGDVVAQLAPEARLIPLPGRLADAPPQGRLATLAARTPMGQAALLRRWIARMAPGVVGALTEAIAPGDTVVSGLLARGVAAALAQARGCPAATVIYTGQLPTLARESFFYAEYFTGWDLGDAFGAEVNWTVATAIGSPLTRQARDRLGLARLNPRAAVRGADRHPILLAASPVLVPPTPDWNRSGRRVHQTGFLAPPEHPYTPEPDLTRALAQRPVYVGFGSFTDFAAKEDVDLIVRAAQLAAVPVILPASSVAAPGPLAPGVFVTGSVPHGWLFPRVAATVHHGGAGTTHEALRSGVPSAGVPFGVDQPYHARRLHELGMGPAPLPRARLTAERLARLLTDLTDSPRTPGYTTRAGEIAATVRTEDGVGRAADVLGELGVLGG